jgi:LemA protein
MSLEWVITGIVVVAAGYVLVAYNSLVRKRNHVKEAWSDIEVQFKRRANLIPNLVETVKGYARHERQAFDSVTAARAQTLSASTPHDAATAQNALTASLRSLFAVAEAYPDLKANTNFLELQRELADTENKIQAAHRFYNTTVNEYNTAIESVPTNIIASLFSFKPAEFFELDDEAARSVPKVSFGT